MATGICKGCGRQGQALDGDGYCHDCIRKRPLPTVTIRFKAFSIVVPKDTEKDFIAELESLCKQYSGQAYHFCFDVEG